VIDEFTSVVDRSVAKSCSSAIHRYIKKHNLKSVVFASCHYDIIDWLRPDWVFDTLTGEYLPRGSLRQPSIELELLPCGPEAWATFSHHHYLSENINKKCKALDLPLGIKCCWICLSHKYAKRERLKKLLGAIEPLFCQTIKGWGWGLGLVMLLEKYT
jgi:hypothetical protein